jgi:hypothetical protein
MLIGPQGETLANYNNDDIRLNISTTAFEFVNGNNTTLFTYGDIVAMAGDFFGPKGSATVICSASSDPLEQLNLFEAAFRQLWTTPRASLISEIRQQFSAEEEAVAGLKEGQAPWQAFSELGELRWGSLSIGKLELWSLLVNNFDHFGSCAYDAYKVGHLAAMTVAREAGQAFDATTFAALSLEERGAKLTKARADLIRAYAMNAFADHFLTDQFSAGHVRTPCVRVPPYTSLSLSPTLQLMGGEKN